jgi:hypothetical protein
MNLSDSEAPNPDKTFTLVLRDSTDKYYSERVMLILLYPMVIGLGTFMLWNFLSRIWRTPPESRGGSIFIVLEIAAILGFAIIFAIRRFLADNVEQKLVSSDKEPALEINDQGISGSIALLEGSQRRRLVKARKARFSLNWDQILSCRFVPGARSGPWLNISAMEPEAATYNIRRDKFFGCERRIVEVLRAHDAEVSIEGELH